MSTAQSRHLVLDSRIIDEAVNAKLTVGEVSKHASNPLFAEDKPWEPRFDNVYANVIYDEDDEIYKCWYNPFIVDERVTSTPPEKRNPESLDYSDIKPDHRQMGLCYAVSTDGIRWDKPDIGLVEFDGNKRNNLLVREIHGAGVFKDVRETDPAKRYKMFHCGSPQMEVLFSADGLRWSDPIPIPEIEAHGTHANACWAPSLGRYVGFTRQHANGTRLVTRGESTDFVKWTKDKTVLVGPNARLQAHDMIVFPTHGIYIGLLGMMTYPEDPKDSAAGVKQHVELAWSPDTEAWFRIQEGTPLVGNTPGGAARYGEMPYDWGTVFASAPIFNDDEIRIYYGACDWYFFDWRKGYLALATLRPDGWAGYEPASAGTEALITTEALAFDGECVGITADVRDGGSVRVAILDEAGEQQAISEPTGGTVTGSPVKWEENRKLGQLRGKEVRLRFQLRDAKLYAFQIN